MVGADYALPARALHNARRRFVGRRGDLTGRGGQMTQVSMSGKTCLVTGASSGIGEATAAALAGMGANVLMVARDPGRGEQAAKKVRQVAGSAGGKVEVLMADL